MERTLIYQLAAAGLLHDVGKFALRADVGASRTWDDAARQEYGYKHALLSADFVEKYVPARWRPEILSAVAYHHRPLTDADRIVTLADRLSAGERVREAGDEARRTVHPRQLLSIFCSVQIPDAEAAPADAYLPLEPLQLRRPVLFPGPARAEDDVWHDYERLWQAFCREAAELREAHEGQGDIAVYLESLQLRLQRYTWCVPSAYFGARPDVSLYDHGRMTGALAAALARSGVHDDGVEKLLAKPDDSTVPVALLVAGDISGVQDFIYTITARGATPALRGRSFYLQMLTEAVARFALRRLDLPTMNLIYAGGGKFYLLGQQNAGELLEEIQRDVSRTFLHHHQGDLYLAISSRALQARDFYGGRIAAAWEELHEQLGQQKQRRFQELGSEMFELFEAPKRGGNADNLCSVCDREHPRVTEVIAGEDGQDRVRKCAPCISYEEVGKALRRANYLTLRQIEPAPPGEEWEQGTYQSALAALGMRVELADTRAEIAAGNGLSPGIFALRDDASQPPGESGLAGRRFLVNVTPILTAREVQELQEDRDFRAEEELAAGNVKPFSVLARQSRGIERLGVLRMDVDNLGQLFSAGLGDRATLSRVAALSFAVSLYFEGWVEKLAEAVDQAEQGQRLYSIYSGGDDLFFVGAWDAVVELALRIRADLSAYTAGHPTVTASAGIALVPPKYPLFQAARDAGEAEKAAKLLAWWDEQGQRREKDSISFLGLTLPWARFGTPDDAAGFSTAVALQRFLAAGEVEKRRPLIRRLSRTYGQYRELEEERRKKGEDRGHSGRPQPLWGPYMYHAVYELSRLAGQSGAKDAGDLLEWLQADEFRNMDQIGLAARWAELSLRREQEE